MKWFSGLAMALVAVLGLSACAVRTGVYVGHPHHAKVVVIERGHAHTDHCGHYFHEGQWHHWEGHHHGPGCGHCNRGGRWEVDVNVRVH